MLNLFNKNRYFFLPYIILMLILGYFLIFYTKKDIHLFTNQFHSPFFDVFFKYFTEVGDGIVVGIFIFILLFVKYRYAIIVSISGIFTIILVHFLKQYMFPDVDRPYLFFKNIHELYYINGVDNHILNSFPSGHTATGFLNFFLFSLIVNNNYLKLLFLIFAVLIGYSRVYLSQHFLIDVYFASIFSILISFFTFYWVSKWKNPKFNNSIIKSSNKR